MSFFEIQIYLEVQNDILSDLEISITNDKIYRTLILYSTNSGSGSTGTSSKFLGKSTLKSFKVASIGAS